MADVAAEPERVLRNEFIATGWPTAGPAEAVAAALTFWFWLVVGPATLTPFCPKVMLPARLPSVRPFWPRLALFPPAATVIPLGLLAVPGVVPA